MHAPGQDFKDQLLGDQLLGDQLLGDKIRYAALLRVKDSPLAYFLKVGKEKPVDVGDAGDTKVQLSQPLVSQ
jgi:hypothetical protein